MGAAAGDFRMRGSCARGDGKLGRRATYESAVTCRFFQACTEDVRVIANEIDVFVHVLMAEDGADKAVEQKRKALFERAAKVHVANAQGAGRGEGLDL